MFDGKIDDATVFEFSGFDDALHFGAVLFIGGA